MKIAVINGPNLNFLGVREPEIYGETTLTQLEERLICYGKTKGEEVICFQSNGEGEIIDFIQQCHLENMDAIVINPGAYTHYSYAISDAIKSVRLPVIEVHISNIYTREDFRKTSVTAAGCIGIISGFGLESYFMAMDAAVKYCNRK